MGKTKSPYFHEYFAEWLEMYKQGAVRPVTLNKYLIAMQRLVEIAPNLRLCDLDKRTYQGIINKYAETHERQTVKDFNHILKASILDAVDEGYIEIDPTRKVVIKGKAPAKKKPKFLNIEDCVRLVEQMDLLSPILIEMADVPDNGQRAEAREMWHNGYSYDDIAERLGLDKRFLWRLKNDEKWGGSSRGRPRKLYAPYERKEHQKRYRINWDWLILLCMKTGLRFAEALALTPNDIDLVRKTVTVSKAIDYKKSMEFMPTKNQSSIRTIAIDSTLCAQLVPVLHGLDVDKPIFTQEGKRLHNSTVNDRLQELCKKANIPTITMHGLRHTHGSILLANGVSILSVSKRLGHSNVATTQEVYLHIIKELEQKDNEKIMSSLASLGAA